MDLAQGTAALYNRTAKQVVCLACSDGVQRAIPAFDPPDRKLRRQRAHLRPTASRRGRAVAAPHSGGLRNSRRFSTSRVRLRSAKSEERIRERNPKLGGLILALSDDPQSTTAWQRGAKSEELLGKRLDELSDRGVRLLRDRQIPGSLANVDHIAISAAGVFVLEPSQVKVLGPKRATEHILETGPVRAEDIDAVHRALAASLPPA